VERKYYVFNVTIPEFAKRNWVKPQQMSAQQYSLSKIEPWPYFLYGSIFMIVSLSNESIIFSGQSSRKPCFPLLERNGHPWTVAGLLSGTQLWRKIISQRQKWKADDEGT
jgi:hypothetical protein